MATLYRSRRDAHRSITTIDDYATILADAMSAYGADLNPYSTTWKTEPVERVAESLAAYAQQLYKTNGLAFAVIGVRCVAFSLVRFAFQRMRNGRGGDIFGTPALLSLERPFPGGTTQDLLTRMLQDADICGNAYHVRAGPDVLRMRPDWVQIILEPIIMNGGIIGSRRVGYSYHNGGISQCPKDEIALFPASQVSHFAPIPDPEAEFRGMSWLSPIVTEIVNDKAMNRHKGKFFANAATPNIAVSLDKAVTPKAFAEFKAIMDAEHQGVDNAYKTLYLGGGADVRVIGANIQQIDFGALQGHGETRVAAAGGVPPIIVGLSEGLNSATYSNYGQAMRRFADLTMTSLWGNAAGSLAPLIQSPGGDTRLWYDTRDVAFLRDDAKARAEVQQIRAGVINQYITGGFTPESAVLAAVNEDETMLVHTGLVSVQLQPPGVDASASADTSTDANAAPPAAAGRDQPLGPLDDVDRALAEFGVHPNPRLAITNGVHP